MRPTLFVLKNVVDAALSRPLPTVTCTGRRGETIGDQRFGDPTPYPAPIVPPLHIRLALQWHKEKTGWLNPVFLFLNPVCDGGCSVE